MAKPSSIPLSVPSGTGSGSPSPLGGQLVDEYIVVRRADQKQPMVTALVPLGEVGSVKPTLEPLTSVSGAIDPRSDVKTWAGLSQEEKNARLIAYTRISTPFVLGLGRGRKRKLNNLRTIMTVGASVDGAAATAYTTVINLRPGGTSEYASIGALYDEVKVHGARLTYVWRIKAASASAGTAAMGIIAYDPLQNSTLSSIENGVQHSQHQFVALPQNDAVPGQTPVVACSRDSYQHFEMKCPTETQRVPGTAGVCTGQWCDTTTTTADWGYIKPYINAVTGQTYYWTYTLAMDCEFRSRS